VTEQQRQIFVALSKKRRIPAFGRLAFPDRHERDYKRWLRHLAEVVSIEVQRQLITRLPSLTNEAYMFRPLDARKDAADDDLVKIINGIKVKVRANFNDPEVKRLTRKLAQDISRYNEDVILRAFKRVAGVNLIFSQAWLPAELAMFVSSNVRLITSLRDGSIDRVADKVLSGWRENRGWESIRDDIMNEVDPRVGNIRSRADLIARDQVAKLNGQLTMLRQTELGIERYIWRTAMDERVRPAHQMLSGRVYSWDKPPAGHGHPGQEYRCRCVAEPYLADLLGVDATASAGEE
jgi:SPP1 gp7 family putative phage head morphogenesis protein